MFSFGLDRRRDDNLSLLEFRESPRADVAHAGGDGADQVLAAIIYFGRAEENLPQRTGGPDFYSRAPGNLIEIKALRFLQCLAFQKIRQRGIPKILLTTVTNDSSLILSIASLCWRS